MTPETILKLVQGSSRAIGLYRDRSAESGATLICSLWCGIPLAFDASLKGQRANGADGESGANENYGVITFT